MEHLLKPHERKKLQDTFKTHPLFSTCFKVFYTRKGKLDGALVKEEDIFTESAWLLDLLWSMPDITQHQIDLLWDKLFNDCREWQADMSDHDKRMVAGTVFHIVRAALAQHYDSHYYETICGMLNCTLERELKGLDVEEQKVFLQRLVEQSPVLSEWINSYDEADKWLSDEIPDAIADEDGEDSGSGTGIKGGKPGAKAKSFRDFIINQDEADKVIDIIRQNILKDNAQQAALLIVGAIEAEKVSAKVTAPSISREFGVNENSIKPHLTKYRNSKNSKQPYFEDSELKSYIALFSNLK
jgi:hypothetical protein